MKAISFREILGRSKDFSKTQAYRETNVQVDKLERMAVAFSKKFEGLRAALSRQLHSQGKRDPSCTASISKASGWIP